MSKREGRHWPGERKAELFAPVFRALSSSFVGTWCCTFDPVGSCQPCRPACPEIYFGGRFQSSLVFPLLPSIFPGKFYFNCILDQKL